MDCITNHHRIQIRVKTFEYACRLAILVLGILALANAGITQEELGWSSFGLGAASLLIHLISTKKCKGLICFDICLLLTSTLVVALIGVTHLISLTDLAWSMVGLNAFGALCSIGFFVAALQNAPDPSFEPVNQYPPVGGEDGDEFESYPSARSRFAIKYAMGGPKHAV